MIPIFSIILTILLPIIALCRLDAKHSPKRVYWYSIGSFAFCCIGIIREVITIKKRLFAGDIGGIEDTIQSVLIISIGSLIIAVVLNAIILHLASERADLKN